MYMDEDTIFTIIAVIAFIALGLGVFFQIMYYFLGYVICGIISVALLAAFVIIHIYIHYRYRGTIKIDISDLMAFSLLCIAIVLETLSIINEI